LKNSGKNLKEIYFGFVDNSTNLAIAKYCQHLKSLCTVFLGGEMETLITILD